MSAVAGMAAMAATALTGAARAVEDNAVSPGVLGFVVVALLGVATWLLIRSMNAQIKKIDLPEGGAPIDPEGGPPADPEGGAPIDPDESPRDERGSQDD